MGILSQVSLKAIENLQSLGAQNLIRHLGGWSPFPLGVVLMVTMRCNLNCKMCLRTEEQMSDASALTLDELEAVIDDLAESFRLKPFIHLSGGEPLLRRDTPELLAYIRQQGMTCSLTTNGLLLERYAEELVRIGVGRINVSLDGPPAINDEIRGVPGAAERALAGIKAIVAARKAAGAAQPTITVNTVMSETNQDSLPEMIPLVADAGADALTYQHLMFTDCVNEHMAPHDADAFVAIVKELPRQGRAAGLTTHLYPRMSTDTMHTYYAGEVEQLRRRCVFPWYMLRVDIHGEITPCHGFVADNVKTKTGSMREVWNNAEFRAFRKALSQQGVFADCGRCCHRQY